MHVYVLTFAGLAIMVFVVLFAVLLVRGASELEREIEAEREASHMR